MVDLLHEIIGCFIVAFCTNELRRRFSSIFPAKICERGLVISKILAGFPIFSNLC